MTETHTYYGKGCNFCCIDLCLIISTFGLRERGVVTGTVHAHNSKTIYQICVTFLHRVASRHGLDPSYTFTDVLPV